MKKTFIFDFDGTIADSIPSNKKIAEMFNSFAEKEKLPQRVSEKDIESFRDEHLLTAIKLLKIPLWKIPFIVKKLQKTLRQDITETKPIIEMKETLQKLKEQGITLGIVSSSPKETIETFLSHHKLEVFDFVHSASNLFGKQRVLKKLLKKHNLNPLKTFYIGDEIRDIDASKKAGIPIIAVTWGFNSKRGLQRYMPEFILENPKDLISLFAN